ncbi:hypothetical protein HispidOSU_014306 [Sigmodon hispidus]
MAALPHGCSVSIELFLCSPSFQLLPGLFVLVSGKLEVFFLRTSRQAAHEMLSQLASEARDLESLHLALCLVLIKAGSIQCGCPQALVTSCSQIRNSPICLDRENCPFRGCSVMSSELPLILVGLTEICVHTSAL